MAVNYFQLHTLRLSRSTLMRLEKGDCFPCPYYEKQRAAIFYRCSCFSQWDLTARKPPLILTRVAKRQICLPFQKISWRRCKEAWRKYVCVPCRHQYACSDYWATGDHQEKYDAMYDLNAGYVLAKELLFLIKEHMEDYSNIAEAWRTLANKQKDWGLTLSGLPQILGNVAPLSIQTATARGS